MTVKRSFYFLAFSLLPLFFVLHSPGRSTFIHEVSLTVTKPFWLASHALSQGIQAMLEGTTRFWGLYESHARLARQVEELERALVDKAELAKENERLRSLLEFKREFPLRAIPARVIGRDLTPWRRTILLDKGFHHGLRKRMAVVSARGLVGRIVELGPLSARVILLTDSESRVSALFQESRDLGIVEGDGSSLLHVTRIEREATVKVGDRVVSSGLGAIYPKGIPVGQVELVGREKEGLELFASVRPAVNFSKLEEVLCVDSSPADS